GVRVGYPRRCGGGLPARRPVRQTAQADGRLGRLLRQGRDGRGQVGRARSYANTAIAPPRREAGLARHRTPPPAVSRERVCFAQRPIAATKNGYAGNPTTTARRHYILCLETVRRHRLC